LILVLCRSTVPHYVSSLFVRCPSLTCKSEPLLIGKDSKPHFDWTLHDTSFGNANVCYGVYLELVYCTLCLATSCTLCLSQVFCIALERNTSLSVSHNVVEGKPSCLGGSKVSLLRSLFVWHQRFLVLYLWEICFKWNTKTRDIYYAYGS
jgi:hypothetical protein